MVLSTLKNERTERLTPSILDQTLAALSDPTRRAVIDELRRSPQRAGELARLLDTTPAGLSRHLRVLRRSGLIVEEGLEDDARVRVYRLRREPFDDLHNWVEEVQSFWDAQLGSFKAHAEARKKKSARTTRGETKP